MMQNFEYHNPTKALFGRGMIARLSGYIPKEARILMVYGGGSIHRNGIYEQVKAALDGFYVEEFGGVEPNPSYETLMKAVAQIRNNNLDYMLAVGGGSVIDGVKFLALAAHFDKDQDPWEIVSKGLGRSVSKAVPFSAVLTLPATGTEMNSSSVITRISTHEKLAFGSPLVFPQISVLDPECVASLPARQIANGITDAFVHVLEQYLTYPTHARLQERIAEGILQTLIEVGPQILQKPDDYDLATDFMWCCTMALNGTLRTGTPTDWASHMIGHELTAMFGIDHARTLAIVAPNLYTVMFESKKEKLAQYGRRVWGLEGDNDHVAHEAISQTRAFFEKLGIQTKLSNYTEQYEPAPNKISETLKNRNWVGLGESKAITPEIVKQILEMSN